jgi:hypothetical protein
VEKTGPLTAQIAASIEDVKALLDDNRSMSVAFLSRRIRDFEEETRKRFLAMETRVEATEAAVKQVKDKLNLAAVKYKELREDVDKKLGSK